MDNLVKIGTLLFLPWVLAALPSIWGGLRAESVVVKIVSGVLILGAGIVSELTVAHIVRDNNQRSVEAQTAALNERTARERERLFAVRATGVRAEFAGSISRTQELKESIQKTAWTGQWSNRKRIEYDRRVGDWHRTTTGLVMKRLPCATVSNYNFAVGLDAPSIQIATLDGLVRELLNLSNSTEEIIQTCSPRAL